MNVDLIVTIVKAVWLLLSIIAVIFSFIASRKGGKWKKVAQTLEDVGEQTEVLMKYIAEAEEYVDYDGKEKFSQVLIKYALHCMETGRKFDEEKATEAINKLVDFTKHVNVPDEPLSE